VVADLGRMDWAAVVVLVLVILCLFSVPVHVIALRSNLEERVGLLGFVLYAGPLILSIWTSVGLPLRHGRSRWWTPPLVVPIMNAIAYWWYAFTLERESVQLALG
jgi:hypothetical protein